MSSRFCAIAPLLLLVLPVLSGCQGEQSDSAGSDAGTVASPLLPLVVYSARKEHLIRPLFDRYTALTGQPIEYITDSAGPLVARLQAEGSRSPADLLLTTDAGNLWYAAQQGLLREVTSSELERVPGSLRDPDGRWYGLSVRARTIVFATDRVSPEELSSYEQLADQTWSGRLCLRTAKKVYNQSLVATMIASIGEQQAESIVAGWVANLALPPFSNDTKVMEAIASGQCDVGIVNTYYYGRLKQERPDLELALFWPNQSGKAPLDRGVHINVSGGGVVVHSARPKAAATLLGWLVSPEAQTLFASLNQEYPVDPEGEVSETVAGWGSFKRDTINLSVAGEFQGAAIRLMDRAGYF